MHEWSARELASKVTSRSLNAVDVAHYFINRVEHYNPSLNAIVQFDPALVLSEAAKVEQRLDHGEVLPLAGVPITIKDNIWVEGRRLSQGSALFSDFIAPCDAWAVSRLRQCGAVVLGITNCSEFACKGVTSNRLYGTTRHPLDLRLTPGGSSGGAATALAAGMGLLALGTDAGGSVRRPAAHCGLVGLKPSAGIIPHPWGFGEPNYGLSVIGLLARDAADCALLLDQLLAYDGGDAASPAVPVALYASALVAALPRRDLRIAWSPQLGCGYAIDTDVLQTLQTRIDALRDSGWAVADADPAWPMGIGTFPVMALQEAGLHALYGSRLAAERDAIDPDLVAQIEAGAARTPDELARVLRLRDRISGALAHFFDDYDVLLCPTTPVTAWPADQLGPTDIGGRPAGPRGHAAFTPLFNYCGVPACSVPAGLVRGLPVGLQIVARRFDDALVLQIAALLESQLRLNTGI
ncbi:MAG: amidase [Herminiimonas sp.]|nr:amidase [Herminiimonas sp.]